MRQIIDGLSAYFSTSGVPSDGSVILNVEAEVTTETSSFGVTVQCILIGFQSILIATNLTWIIPECDASGDCVVLYK